MEYVCHTRTIGSDLTGELILGDGDFVAGFVSIWHQAKVSLGTAWHCRICARGGRPVPQPRLIAGGSFSMLYPLWVCAREAIWVLETCGSTIDVPPKPSLEGVKVEPM